MIQLKRLLAAYSIINDTDGLYNSKNGEALHDLISFQLSKIKALESGVISLNHVQWPSEFNNQDN